MFETLIFKAGDTLLDQKYSHNFENEPSLLTVDDSKDYSFAYPLLMEARIRKLKLSLESWREIVMLIKSIFLWERSWHPSAIVGGSTIMFTFIWLLDPSVLTIVSIVGICLTIADYLIPVLTASLYKTEKWSVKKEKEYENICTDIVLHKAKIELAWASYYRMKTTNRKMYFVSTITCLTIFAWIGCTFNNLLLAYITATLTLLYPGMDHHGIILKGRCYVHKFVGELLNQSKFKSENQKND